MLKSLLVATAIVVFTASSAPAAVLTFLGSFNNLSGGTFAGKEFTLTTTVVDAGASAGNNFGTLVNSKLEVVGGPVIFGVGGTASFFGTTPTALSFNTGVGSGLLNFSFATGSAPVATNAIQFNNLYEFMYGAGATAAFSGFIGAQSVGGSLRAVPEPMSMAAIGILTLGGAGLGIYRRRRSSTVA